MTSERRWLTPYVGAAVGSGVIVGIGLAEWSRLVDWILDTSWDWSSLPAVTIGTAIPAGLAFMFAGRLAEGNTRVLHRAQLDAEREFRSEMAGKEELEAEARRQRWDEIVDICKRIGDHLEAQPGGPWDVMRAVVMETNAEVRSVPSEQRGSMLDGHAADMFTRYLVVWPIVIREDLRALESAVAGQIEHGGAVGLAPVLEAITVVAAASERESLWVPPDVVEVARRLDDEYRERETQIRVVSESSSCWELLQALADRERSIVPAAAFNPEVTRMRASGAWNVNVVQAFNHLRDEFEALEPPRGHAVVTNS